MAQARTIADTHVAGGLWNLPYADPIAGARGETATLEVNPLAANCRAVVVHLPGGGTKAIPPQQGGTVTFPVAPPAGTAPASRG